VKIWDEEGNIHHVTKQLTMDSQHMVQMGVEMLFSTLMLLAW
jgi:hypothetical protein